MDSESIVRLIEEAIAGSSASAVDLKGTGDHFEVTVVADGFDGRSMVEQHRMVYAALGDAIRESIHALSLRTMTPRQYQQGLVTKIPRS